MPAIVSCNNASNNPQAAIQQPVSVCTPPAGKLPPCCLPQAICLHRALGAAPARKMGARQPQPLAPDLPQQCTRCCTYLPPAPRSVPPRGNQLEPKPYLHLTAMCRNNRVAPTVQNQHGVFCPRIFCGRPAPTAASLYSTSSPAGSATVEVTTFLLAPGGILAACGSSGSNSSGVKAAVVAEFRERGQGWVWVAGPGTLRHRITARTTSTAAPGMFVHVCTCEAASDHTMFRVCLMGAKTCGASRV